MPDQIPQIRVFLSSPSDVADERKIALEVIEHLRNRPTFRERVAFYDVAWDKSGAGTPMLATLTPQEAINQGLPKPSECDIVVVLLWSRMGTPFKGTDGKEYLSGTHWEMLDALNSKRAETVIYRRTEEKRFKSDDKEGIEQSERVKEFFRSELFYKDGSIVRGINEYKTPDDFRQHFETDFESLVLKVLKKREVASAPVAPPPDLPQITPARPQRRPQGKSSFLGRKTLYQSRRLALIVGIVVLVLLLGAVTVPLGINLTPASTLPPVTFVPSDKPAPTVDSVLTLDSPQVTNANWQPVSETVNGVEMVRVPKGCFEMGSDKSKDKDANLDELPAHKVCFDQEFRIDKYEVSEASFRQFYEEDGYEKQEYWSDAGWQWRQDNKVNNPKDIPALRDNYPRRGVSWYEAEAYAHWRGECLPTESQWEYAARGQSSLIYPWGNEFLDSNANTSQNPLKNLAYIDAFPKGESWVGAYNLAGNVWEWVRDFYSPYPELTATSDVQKPLSKSDHILRGGSWNDDPLRARSAFRLSDDPRNRENTYGIRLASC